MKMRNRTMRSRALIAAAVLWTGCLLAGCGASGGKAGSPAAGKGQSSDPAAKVKAAASLAGTKWRLVEIQSMDDSVGTKRPSDPSQYTMHLNGDGTVFMHLNCNSANGKWSAQPGQDSAGGLFEFGPLAATRALCPPPSLDEEIAAQSRFIRSYLLKDEKLYLSLMADGGIWAWEPLIEGAVQAKPDHELEAAILAASPSYKKAAIGDLGESGQGRYACAFADLNGDGKEEVFVYLMGSFFCGTGGCNLQLFSRGAAGYMLVGEFSISRVPVIVSASESAGWKDLWRRESGGGAPASYVRHVYDGKKYVERERVPGAQVPEGKPFLTGAISYDNGTPLSPTN